MEEEYHGPVLLSSDAGADTMRALIANSITATRPKLGTEARTNGAFASSYHARVLPEFLDVVDDPGLKSWSGKGLLGAYAIDDDGVPAQAVKLVTAGRLENYLIGREPVKDFPQSNGHGRAGIATGPRPAIGVLQVSDKDGLSDDALNAKLLDMAKDRGLKSVYYVATLGGELSPRLLYRVTPDGTPPASVNWCVARRSTIWISEPCAPTLWPREKTFLLPTTLATCRRLCSRPRCSSTM